MKLDDRAAGGYRLPLLPLRDIIVFPHMVVPLFVGRDKSLLALEEAMAGDKQLLLAAQRRAKTDDPSEDDIFSIGTVGHIIQLLRFPKGPVKVLVEGRARARIRGFAQSEPFFVCDVEDVEETEDDAIEIQALIRSVQDVFEDYVKLNTRIPPEMLVSVRTIEEPGRLADTIVAHVALKLKDKQELLETPSPSRSRRRADAGRDRDSPGREEAALAGQEADGEAAEGVLSQRADAGDPEGARRRARRVQERAQRARAKDQAEEDEQGGQGSLPQGAQEAQADVADERRGHRRAQLPRLGHRAALGRQDRGPPRHQRGRGHPRGRALRPQEGQGAHPRVPRRPDPRAAPARTDPLPG